VTKNSSISPQNLVKYCITYPIPLRLFGALQNELSKKRNFNKREIKTKIIIPSVPWIVVYQPWHLLYTFVNETVSSKNVLLQVL